MKIISATERLAAPRGAKMLIVGPSGVGKTSLLRTVDPARTLFVDIESGDLSIQDLAIDTIRLGDWPTARDLAVRISGPNPSYPPTACYSQAHFEGVGGWMDNLDRYDTVFIDSITAAGRLSFRWSQQQPEAFAERSGKPDVRGAFGLHARESLAWLHQLQSARAKNVVLVGILERVVDDYGRPEWGLQHEGAKTSRELPGILDEVITMQFVPFDDGPKRAFVCTSPNEWNWPAKDRSGRLDQIEEPHLGRLIDKLTSKATKQSER